MSDQRPVVGRVEQLTDKPPPLVASVPMPSEALRQKIRHLEAELQRLRAEHAEMAARIAELRRLVDEANRIIAARIQGEAP